MVEMVAHGIFGEARGLGARQPVLGLALKLRITDEDRQHHLAAVEYILGGDLRRLFLPDQFAERAQPFGQCGAQPRSEEHTSELQSLRRISYTGFCLKKKNTRPYKPYDIISYSTNHTPQPESTSTLRYTPTTY